MMGVLCNICSILITAVRVITGATCQYLAPWQGLAQSPPLVIAAARHSSGGRGPVRTSLETPSERKKAAHLVFRGDGSAVLPWRTGLGALATRLDSARRGAERRSSPQAGERQGQPNNSRRARLGNVSFSDRGPVTGARIIATHWRTVSAGSVTRRAD